jgi:predicted nucleic acid-binding protein
VRGEHVVIDAAALLDLLASTGVGTMVGMRIEGCVLHAPAHIDAEVLSGLGRLERAGVLGPSRARAHLVALAAAPIERHPVSDVLEGSWNRRDDLRPLGLGHVLYVELARSLGLALITTDPLLARAKPFAELIGTDRASQSH